jgi:putative FmdB family regulatory protein
MHDIGVLVYDGGMPTYEYRCNGCNREFEIFQKMADPDLVHCDECGEDKLEKLISWTTLRNGNSADAIFADNPREAVRSTFDRSLPPKKPST